MDLSVLSRGNHQIAKRRKFNNKHDERVDRDGVAAENIKQTSEIFKLDIDCFEEAFDYFRIGDLLSISETCKRLQQVAGYWFQQNYFDLARCVDDSGIGFYYSEQMLSAKNLLRFVQKIEIHSEGFQYFFDELLKLRQLRNICIRDMTIADMSRLKEISMAKLEVLCIYECDLGSDFYEILDQCMNLKRLEISQGEGIYSWFGRYPTLEYLKWDPLSLKSIEDITMFLANNPNIRKFATNSSFFWECCNTMVKFNIKLDDLAIKVDSQNIDKLNSICGLLNELHKLGLYKKLQLYLENIPNQEMANQLANVNGLSKLFVCDVDAPLCEYSAFTNLEELCYCNSQNVADLQMLPNKLTNLKRIEIGVIDIDDVILFIRRSVELQKIKLNVVDFNDDTEIIDLVALNRERGQLPDAAKVTLYVYERIYLATKWALGQTDFKFIRLKRHTSHEWHHDFFYDFDSD